MSRLREINGLAPGGAMGELRRQLELAHAEADKWRRLHQAAGQALLFSSMGLALAGLAIAFLVATRGCS